MLPQRKEKVKCPCCNGYGWVEVLKNKLEEKINQKVKIEKLNKQIQDAKEEE